MTMEKTVKIPNLEKYEKLIIELRDQFEYSFNNCVDLLQDLKSNEHINQKERSNYMDFEQIDYLLTDFKNGGSFCDDFSRMSKMIEELKEFKKNLDSYDSDL
jgi:hypothetical protein